MISLSDINEIRKIAEDRVAAGMCPRCGINSPTQSGICEECEHDEESNECYE